MIVFDFWIERNGYMGCGLNVLDNWIMISVGHLHMVTLIHLSIVALCG